MQLIVTCILTVLQLWTLRIHYGLWLRSRGGERTFGSQKEDELDASGSSSLAAPSSTSHSSDIKPRIDDDKSDRKYEFPVSLVAQDTEDNSPV